MTKQIALRPVDVAVALRLSEAPDATYAALGADLGVSTSTAHESVERLSCSGLVHPHRRCVNRTALLEFLEHGVRYAFPAVVGGRDVRGVPTAHAAPVLCAEFGVEDAFVWPEADGNAFGESLQPLYERAVELPGRCAGLYDMLALVDALRVGRARERRIAAGILRDRLARPEARTRA